MNCEQLREATCAYLGEGLEPGARTAFDAHLGACDSCRRFLELARSTTCKQVADFLSDYLEDELADEERAAFERHLRLCPPCVDYMHTLETTIEAGHSLCDEPCPPVPDALVRAILEARHRS
jgi:anti-sigma factor RsiW